MSIRYQTHLLLCRSRALVDLLGTPSAALVNPNGRASPPPPPPSWAHKVSWERADVFKPAMYGALLKGADFVVHSMGILLEADYKGVISGRESPIAGLQKAFSSAKGHTPNPLERKGGNGFKAPESSSQLTYEMMNRDSAILVAKEAARRTSPPLATYRQRQVLQCFPAAT